MCAVRNGFLRCHATCSARNFTSETRDFLFWKYKLHHRDFIHRIQWIISYAFHMPNKIQCECSKHFHQTTIIPHTNYHIYNAHRLVRIYLNSVCAIFQLDLLLLIMHSCFSCWKKWIRAYTTRCKYYNMVSMYDYQNSRKKYFPEYDE